MTVVHIIVLITAVHFKKLLSNCVCGLKAEGGGGEVLRGKGSTDVSDGGAEGGVQEN